MKEPIDMNEAEMRARFDFSKATRGRFAERYKNGHTVTLLDHDPDEDDTAEPVEVDETTRQSGMRILECQIRDAGLRLDVPSNEARFDYVIRVEAEGGRRVVSYPVKVKTSVHEVFALYQRDSEIPHLLMAYVWHAKGASQPEVYALSYEEALQIVRSKPYKNSKAWNEDGGYSVTHSGTELREMLKDHRMTPEKWHQRLQSI